MSFGSTLAHLRHTRGWSQEALALNAGLSQRHISFLETGRAKPGQRSLAQLTHALALKAWEQRALLETIVPPTPQTQAVLPDDDMITNLMARFSPWPAYAYRPDGSLVGTNKALDGLFARVSPEEDLWQITAPQSGPNIYDLLFHPRGLICWLENKNEVIPETLRRLRIEVLGNPSLRPLLKRIEAYPSAAIGPPNGALPPPILIERYHVEGHTLAIMSILSQLASPGELSLNELRIESFVPADEASAWMLT
jgi:transcriptional regulator with XRE-family HTH domain